jgi:hypothetical protein
MSLAAEIGKARLFTSVSISQAITTAISHSLLSMKIRKFKTHLNLKLLHLNRECKFKENQATRFDNTDPD